jgi:hypothetical protein
VVDDHLADDLRSVDDRYPRALLPRWPDHDPDADLLLFEGAAEVAAKPRWQTGEGRAMLRWRPRPHVALRVDFDGHPHDVRAALEGQDNPRVGIRVASQEGTAVVAVVGGATLWRCGDEWRQDAAYAELEVQELTFRWSEQPAVELRFDVVNLDAIAGAGVSSGEGAMWHGRLVLRGGGWTITADARQDLREVHDSVGRDGGCVVTHTCVARLDSGAAISLDQAKSFLTAFQYVLSVAQARWATPIVPRGHASDGSVAWEIWDVWNCRPWSPALHPLPQTSSESIHELCERLLDFWFADHHNERVLRSAVHFYLDMNDGGLLTRHIIVSFALFELVGWSILVEQRRMLSENGFDRGLEADDKLRRLLSTFSVPTEIPTQLEALKNRAMEEGWPDLPKAVTELRHAAVHARRQDDHWAWGHEVWIDAARACDWLADVAILALLGYRGLYVDRITCRWAEDATPVPWAAPGHDT